MDSLLDITKISAGHYELVKQEHDTVGKVPDVKQHCCSDRSLAERINVEFSDIYNVN